MKTLKKTKIAAILLIIAIIIGGACVGLYIWGKKFQAGWGPATLAAAIYCHYDYYHNLPDNIYDITKTNFYGIDGISSYAPDTKQVKVHDIPVYYLKASQPGFIAVYMPMDDKTIAYIIAPEPRAYFTTPEELQKLLKADNQKRFEANQPTWNLNKPIWATQE